MTQRRLIRDFMTPLPHVIGVGQDLRTAFRRMTHLGVRHLPVTDAEGAVVGVVSQREVSATLARGVDPERTPIETVMKTEPFVVPPDAPLSMVARQMAAQRVGSAIVVDGADVVGVITTTDALGLLADLLTGYLGHREDDLTPSEVRERILAEHRVLRELVRKVDDLASRTLEDDEEAAAELPFESRELHQLLLRHLEVEDRILVRALREGGAQGRRVADALEEEHALQRGKLREALSALDRRPEGGTRELAEMMKAFAAEVSRDIEHEESDVLTEQLLRDDTVLSDLFTG